MNLQKSRVNVLVATALVALMIGAACGASAQGYQLLANADAQLGDSFFNTPTLQCAEPLPAGSTLVWGDVRTWELDNWTFAAGARTNVSEDIDAEITFFNMNTSGEDAINGAVRDSKATLLGLNFKWVAHRSDRMTVSIIPGVEFPLGDLKGTNTRTQSTAVTNDTIPVIAVPFEFSAQEGTIFRLVPRWVSFDSTPAIRGTDDTIAGFGHVLAIGVAVLHDFGEYSVMADGSFLLDGENTIDAKTNQPTDEFVWSVGGAWHPVDKDTRVELFATNSAGPTAASSIIATPDDSIGVGVRFSSSF